MEITTEIMKIPQEQYRCYMQSICLYCFTKQIISLSSKDFYENTEITFVL